MFRLPQPSLVRRAILASPLIAVLLGLALSLPACWQAHPRLELVSVEAWNETLEEAHGSAAAVMIWAGWCRSCVELLPEYVSLEQRYSPRGVVFMSLCLDDFQDKADVAEAERILKEARAAFPNYLLLTDIADAYQRLGLAALPTVLVYDRHGDLRHELQPDERGGGLQAADIEDAIESVSANQSAPDSGRSLGELSMLPRRVRLAPSSEFLSPSASH
jgi:thiol-disulfide isomerase/thioredoxin